jgi:hypothetical protein
MAKKETKPEKKEAPKGDTKKESPKKSSADKKKK